MSESEDSASKLSSGISEVMKAPWLDPKDKMKHGFIDKYAKFDCEALSNLLMEIPLLSLVLPGATHLQEIKVGSTEKIARNRMLACIVA